MATDDQIPLGPFALETPIGHGGMGEVWRGRHREQATPVAVKVLSSERARQDDYLELFRNEVQAVAGLDHPGIVLVLDQGLIPEETEVASEGRLTAGSPFLAMEYCGLGSLAALPLPLHWSELKALLLGVLCALGHAHARGVIHRDIKPENVLLSGHDDFRPGVKLSDFGLAHAAEDARRTSDSGGVAGTPLYMAPEQATGTWRDYGPWTDLFALGCLAYELACGHPPFTGRTPLATLAARLKGSAPTPEPLGAVPDGFADWLGRLLQREPSWRFRRAADAAWALVRLGDPLEDWCEPKARVTLGLAATLASPEAAAARASRQWFECSTLELWREARAETRKAEEVLIDDDAPTVVGPAPVARRDTRWLESARRVLPEERTRALAWLGLVGQSRSEEDADPTIPDDVWRRDAPPLPLSPAPPSERSAHRLLGAGLGLYGVRRLPLVDREAEQRRIWLTLRDVLDRGRPRAVAVRGGAGIGKSHLMRTVAERAHEVGSADVLWATHSPNGGPADGIPRMLGRYLNCLGLGRRELLERTRNLLQAQGVTDAYEWRALAEIMRPSNADVGATGGAAWVRLADPAQRHVVVTRLLQRLGRRRPLVLLLDDVQWGREALGLVEFLLESALPIPVLVLLGVRDDVLDERPIERDRLNRLVRIDTVTEVTLDLLPGPHRAELVRQLLGLEGDLATQVEARTAGHPLFAVQLVGDWVERGVLRPGRSGFELRPGERADLPDDIHGLWMGRVDRVLEGLADDSSDDGLAASGRRALSLAACLGQTVDAVEWQAACRVAKVVVPGELIYRLVTRNLAHSTELGWAFSHAMLRESLERHAREAEHWAANQQACADTLAGLYAPGSPGLAERIAYHRLEAGQLNEALVPLLVAARERLDRGDLDAAGDLLEKRQLALEAVRLPEGERPWCEGWVIGAELATAREQGLDQALANVQRAARHARQRGFDDLVPEALRHVGHIVQRRGHLAEAATIFGRARQLFEAAGMAAGAAHCIDREGAIALQQGRVESARQLLGEANDRWRALGNDNELAGNLLRLGALDRIEGQYDASMREMQAAYTIYERLDHAMGVAGSLNALAETARARGDLRRAETDYRAAMAKYRAIGSGAAVYPQLNLCLIRLSQRRWNEARLGLEELLSECQARGQHVLLGSVHTHLLPALAGTEDWDSWDAHFDTATRLLSESGAVESDDAWASQLAGELAAAKGRRLRARRVLELSHRLWTELGHDEDAARVAQQLERLSAVLR